MTYVFVVVGGIIAISFIGRYFFLEMKFKDEVAKVTKKLKEEYDQKIKKEKDKYERMKIENFKYFEEKYFKALKGLEADFKHQKLENNKKTIEFMAKCESEYRNRIKKRILEILKDDYFIRFPAPSFYHESNRRTAEENSFISRCKTINYADYDKKKDRFFV